MPTANGKREGMTPVYYLGHAHSFALSAETVCQAFNN